MHTIGHFKGKSWGGMSQYRNDTGTDRLEYLNTGMIQEQTGWDVSTGKIQEQIGWNVLIQKCEPEGLKYANTGIIQEKDGVKCVSTGIIHEEKG